MPATRGGASAYGDHLSDKTGPHITKQTALLGITLAAILAVTAIAGAYLIAPAAKSSVEPSVPGGELSVHLALNVTVLKSSTNHTVIANRYEANDLLTNNFFLWLGAMMTNAPSGGSSSSSLKSTGGASVTYYGWSTVSEDCPSAYYNCVNVNEGGLIEVGTGTTAAARADYVLTTPFQSFFGTSTACATGSTDSVTISGAENAASGGTITEAGLFLQQYYNSATFMFAHDVFTGISVSSGNTIVIQYTLSLNNAGFNFNLCQFLASALTQPNGQGGTIKVPTQFLNYYDSQGRTDALCYGAPIGNPATINSQFVMPLFGITSTSAPNIANCGYWYAGLTGFAANAVQICIGTGSPTFSPTSYELAAQVSCGYVTAQSYDSAGNLYLTTDIIVSPGATISEAGLFWTIPNGGSTYGGVCLNYNSAANSGAGSCSALGSATFMFLAATFTGVAVSGGSGIGITFQISG